MTTNEALRRCRRPNSLVLLGMSLGILIATLVAAVRDWRVAWRSAAVAVLLSSIVLTTSACSGGNGNGAPMASTSAAGATGSAASLVPDRDTLYDRAPKAMKEAWSFYTVTIIPGRDVLTSVPSAPPVRNMTQGRVPDNLAQRWAQDLIRRRRLAQWALANGQIDFLDWLGEYTFGDDTWRAALEQQHRVVLPDCATYPTSLSLWVADTPRDPVVLYNHVYTYFAMEFNGPCSVSVPPSSVVSVPTSWSGRHVVLVAGGEFTDDLIGDVLRGMLTDCTAAPPGHEVPCRG